jgi:hypothetical protein
MVDAMPHLIVREVTTAVLMVAVILMIAMFFDAPLADQANPGLSPNPTKAPWYFMGLQELLMHFHPVFSVFVIPLILLAGLLSIPYLNYEVEFAGVWFCSHKGRKIAAFAAVLGGAATLAAVLLDDFATEAGLAGPPNVINNGLIPFATILAACASFYVVMKKGFKANSNETIQALFTLLMASFVVLTVIGVWFRGTGMQLMWAG